VRLVALNGDSKNDCTSAELSHLLVVTGKVPVGAEEAQDQMSGQLPPSGGSGQRQRKFFRKLTPSGPLRKRSSCSPHTGGLQSGLQTAIQATGFGGELRGTYWA
jgi:hypothetical protein